MRVVVAHLHSRRVRGYLVAHPSSSSLTEEEKDEMMFCVADATVKETVKSWFVTKQLALLLIAEECLRRRLRTTISSTTTKE